MNLEHFSNEELTLIVNLCAIDAKLCEVVGMLVQGLSSTNRRVGTITLSQKCEMLLTQRVKEEQARGKEASNKV